MAENRHFIYDGPVAGFIIEVKKLESWQERFIKRN